MTARHIAGRQFTASARPHLPRLVRQGLRLAIGIWSLTLASLAALQAQRANNLIVDFSKSQGVFRALHGINKGPLAAGGIVDVTEDLQALGLPGIRLHDCHWPNPDVVDIHAVFPDFHANPGRAANYDFALTDEYLAAANKTGAQLIYRLGESIEHTSKRHHVHPPDDPSKWADICLGLIRHYNEGWAGGTHLGIRYWEIWNEPENRPAMWSGTDEDYFRLYRVAAKRIKKRYPDLKVGGPAVGAIGNFVTGSFQPTAFVTNFLSLCRRESLPLDFFSWHCYTADSTQLSLRARVVRHLLDTYGFTNTESHLNEWNYLPGNSWEPLGRSAPPVTRQTAYEQMAGPAGASFLVTALLELQDAPVDMCNLFHGELGGFGLFNEYGMPHKNYYGLLAFHGLLDTPRRVLTRGDVPGQLGLAAGMNADGTEASILASNLTRPKGDFRIVLLHLPWTGPTVVETRLVDATHDLSPVARSTNAVNEAFVNLQLRAPGVALIRLHPAPQPGEPPEKGTPPTSGKSGG
ncbi:MAG TPA: hypothetical protein VMB21_15050 [Candidatus Limnocylindria bacterium]|nr:hypothetical protein [Candidatus Limnocylindria bacterium]